MPGTNRQGKLFLNFRNVYFHVIQLEYHESNAFMKKKINNEKGYINGKIQVY